MEKRSSQEVSSFIFNDCPCDGMDVGSQNRDEAAVYSTEVDSITSNSSCRMVIFLFFLPLVQDHTSNVESFRAWLYPTARGLRLCTIINKTGRSTTSKACGVDGLSSGFCHVSQPPLQPTHTSQ